MASAVYALPTSSIPMMPVEDWQNLVAVGADLNIDIRQSLMHTDNQPIAMGMTEAGGHPYPNQIAAIVGQGKSDKRTFISSDTPLIGMDVRLALNGTFAGDTELKYYPASPTQSAGAPSGQIPFAFPFPYAALLVNNVASNMTFQRTLNTNGDTATTGHAFRLQPHEVLWGGYFSIEALGVSTLARLQVFQFRRLRAISRFQF